MRHGADKRRHAIPVLAVRLSAAEELRAAKANPDAYKSLRVRVSGFSAYFTTLSPAIQDDILARTVH